MNKINKYFLLNFKRYKISIIFQKHSYKKGKNAIFTSLFDYFCVSVYKKLLHIP